MCRFDPGFRLTLVSVGFRDDQVNMVRHQAIPLDLQREPCRRFPEVLDKHLPVRVHEEDIQAVVPTLRHVVGHAGNHDSGISRHALILTVRDRFRNRKQDEKLGCVPGFLQLAGINRAKQSQLGRSARAPKGEMCETNPIPGKFQV